MTSHEGQEDEEQQSEYEKHPESPDDSPRCMTQASPVRMIEPVSSGASE